MVTKVNDPFPVIGDLDGTPLEGGYIYIGQPGLDAEAFPQAVFWDVAQTIAATQPIRTLGGRFVNLGSQIGNLYLAGDYSILAKDENMATVFSADTANNVDVSEIISANQFGADKTGTVDSRDAFHDAAAYLDSIGGGALTAQPGTYLIESEWTLPCGVDLVDTLGRVVLKYTEAGGNGIFCSTDAARLGQHSKIYGITFARSGSDGASAIYTEDDNAAFFTQSSHWDIQRCTFLDLDATYTLPPSPFTGGPQYGWLVHFDISHSNGTKIHNNDVYGAYNPYATSVGQPIYTGVRLGSDGTNGVIAVDISHNRLWYLHTALEIGEDVLAFWFENNECIKCFRGINAPADPLSDGVSLQADTRINNNFITTQAVGINLINRQLLHIVGNHTNSDAGYFDEGSGFNGIRLENCSKYKLRGNSANLSAGHAGWTGPHRAVLLTASDGGSVSDQQVSRYIDEAIYLNGSNDVRIDGLDLTQVTDAAFAFVGTCRNITIGAVNYINAEPTARYTFSGGMTDIHDLTITADRFVVPSQTTTLSVAANAVSVDRKSHSIDTSASVQTVNTATGVSVRNGVRMTLRASSTAFALTVADSAGGVGQFLLSGNFVTTDARDFLEVEYSEAFSAWIEISRSDNL